jgi:thymidylate kinase
MLTFIEGPQLSGKSTLIDELSKLESVDIKKFPFTKYSNYFNLKTPDELKGFQLGKDLAMLYFLSKNNKTLVDRGPLSSLYYSLFLDRMDLATIEGLLTLIAVEFGEVRFVFVIPKNRPADLVRDKKDRFDQIEKQKSDNLRLRSIKLVIDLAKSCKIDLRVFENDFNLSPEENARNLYNLLGGRL